MEKFKIKNMQFYGDGIAKQQSLANEVITKFQSMFDKETVSIGSCLRKLAPTLLTLSAVSRSTWAATVLYKMKTNIFIFRYISSELDMSIDLISSCDLGTRAESVRKAVNDSFYHDKIFKYPISQSQVTYTTNVGRFEYEKKLIIDDPETLAVWRCSPLKKTLWERIAGNDILDTTISILNTEAVSSRL